MFHYSIFYYISILYNNMDSSGRSIANVHNGDTFINGSLTVQEQILVGDAEGKSEYLDSGKYTQTFSNPFYVDAFFYNNETYYTKNGNFVTIIFNVGLLTPSFTFQTSRNQAFDVTVPSLDLFDTKMVTAPPVGTGGNSLFQVTNITYQSEGVIRITLTASDSTLSTTRPLNSNFSVTYKLEGDDIPATAIISGGGGSGGDVRNPMIENLNGGGFNIINVDTLAVNNVTAQGTITANLISAPNVVTNPLTSILDVNNLGLTNVAIISGSGGETKFGGDKLKDVGEVNNSGTLLIDGNVGLDLDSLSGTINTLTDVDCKTNQILNSSVIETDIVKANSGADLTLESLSIGSSVFITPNFLFRANAQEIELNTSGASLVLDISGNTTLTANNILNLSANDILVSGLLNMTTNNIENATDIKCIGLTTNNISANTGQNLTLSNGGSSVNLFNSGNMTIASSNQVTFIATTVNISAVNVSIGAPVNMLGNSISNCRKMNNIFYINQESDFPNPLVAGTYHIQDIVIMTQPLTIMGDCSFFGMGRDSESELRFQDTTTPSGYCINITDYNVSFQNLKLSNQSTNINLLNASNSTKANFLLFTNCFFTDCKNAEVFNIFGFDLVDLNQCLFMFNYTTTKHLYVDSSSKLQISSCEFLRQFEKGSSPANWGTANMVDLYGTMGAVNISGCLFHAQQTQIALYIDNAQTALENVVAGNTFISIGQTTGGNIEYDITLHPELVIDGNSGIINEKAVIEGSVEGNTVYTATVAGQYVSLNVPNITHPVINRFIINAGSQIEYVGKKPITALINANITADQSTGGNDDCRFGNFQNGVLVSSIGISLNSGTPKSFSYTAILTLQQNDTIEFVCQNITAGTDAQGFRATEVNATLVEI